MRITGRYHVDGIGYATTQAIVTQEISAPWLLLILQLCKLAATWLSLGSGSSGGEFAPALLMGATLGGAFPGLLPACAPALPINLPSFALAGMGAMVGSATGAPLVGIVMVLEMTQDSRIILPVISAVAVAASVRRLLSFDTIYTISLVLAQPNHLGSDPMLDSDAASRRERR